MLIPEECLLEVDNLKGKQVFFVIFSHFLSFLFLF